MDDGTPVRISHLEDRAIPGLRIETWGTRVRAEFGSESQARGADPQRASERGRNGGHPEIVDRIVRDERRDEIDGEAPA